MGYCGEYASGYVLRICPRLNSKYSQKDWKNVALHANYANQSQPTSKLSIVARKILLNKYISQSRMKLYAVKMVVKMVILYTLNPKDLF